MVDTDQKKTENKRSYIWFWAVGAGVLGTASLAALQSYGFAAFFGVYTVASLAYAIIDLKK